jgi:hypothetical protein
MLLVFKPLEGSVVSEQHIADFVVTEQKKCLLESSFYFVLCDSPDLQSPFFTGRIAAEQLS